MMFNSKYDLITFLEKAFILIFVLGSGIIFFTGCKTTATQDKKAALSKSVLETSLDEKDNLEKSDTTLEEKTENDTVSDIEPVKNKSLHKAEPKKPRDPEKETTSIIQAIKDLEECYRTESFDKWKNFLTPAYIEKHSNPEFLHTRGWDADTLESFFNMLVKTRKESNISSLPISRVEFISENKAFVYVRLGDREFPEPQHTFIRINNRWFKGLPEEGE